MNKTIHYLSIVAVAISFSGCAATYMKPSTLNQVESSNIHASRAAIMKAAKRTLVTQGNQITSYDNEAGIISTAPRNQKVTPEQADCGKTMGLDYLKDNRTETNVGYGVIIDDSGRITVRATIQGNYRPGAVDQNMTLTCVSRGVLEKRMLSDIKASL